MKNNYSSTIAKILLIPAAIASSCLVSCVTIEPLPYPGPGSGQIRDKVPTRMRVTKIEISRFPANKREKIPRLPWDAKIGSGKWPDLFLASSTWSFSPKAHRNATPGRGYMFYDRSGAYVKYGDSRYTINLKDEDPSRHDQMGSFSFVPTSLYPRDGAESSIHTVRSRSVTARVHVVWRY